MTGWAVIRQTWSFYSWWLMILYDTYARNDLALWCITKTTENELCILNTIGNKTQVWGLKTLRKIVQKFLYVCFAVIKDELTILRCWRSSILECFKTHLLQLLSFMSVDQSFWMWRLFNSIYLFDSLLLSSSHSPSSNIMRSAVKCEAQQTKVASLLGFLFLLFWPANGQDKGRVMF